MNIREEFLKSQLKDYIKEYSFRYKEDGFVLQSGKISKYYINMKPLLHNQCFLYLLTSIIKDYIEELRFKYSVNINGIGGPGYGALPMASATLMRLLEVNDTCINNMYSFSIRDKKKDHGVNNFLDGPINKNDAVMILDDVVTTGDNILKSVSNCLDYGLRPLAIFSIVNRENLDLQKLLGGVFYIKNLFTLGDFIEDT
jgi:orotate phosphoribosyltransferase